MIAGMLDRLERRELTAEDLVRSLLRRIEEREPVVHAWEHLDPEQALAHARRIDRQRDPPWLRGLPIGVKDLIDTADLPTEYGTSVRRGHRPDRDAACVAALRDSGAVILGKTVTTELASYSPGKTRNPRDPARTPGGSSSGSAAAVADGMVPAALGSQTAGSVIRPASYCGVVGFKPTYGVLDLAGVHPLAPSLDTLGFFVETLEDAPIVLAALRGQARPGALVPRKPRIGLCRTEQWGLAEPTTQDAVEAAAAKLDARDVELEPGLAEAQDIVMAVEAASALASERAAGEERLSRKLRDLLERGDRCPREQYDEAVARMGRARAGAADAFRDADVLLTPAAPGEAPAGLLSTGDPAFNRIWTLLGVPCLSLPILRGPAGLPLGLQLIAAPGKDLELLAAAAWIEGRLG